MANKIYQLQYDDDIDADIHDFIEQFPRNRKAEMVRHAIRYYLSYYGKEIVPTFTPPMEKKRPEGQRERPTMDIGGNFI